ncbi:MAG: phosphoglucosamine mutase [Opitutae bacterium]
MNQYFGTDGIRGTYGSELINEAFAHKVGQAIGAYFQKEKQDKPTVAIASDTRPSGSSLKSSVILGLRSMAVRVIDFGIVPTPALAFGVLKHQANFGVMITASHNPSCDNGIKCFSALGAKLRSEQELLLESLIEQAHDISPASPAVEHHSILEDYLKNLETYFAGLDLSGVSIALDCANGSTSESTHRILETLGANVFKIHHGDGVINSECGSENLGSLQDLVHERKADLGIAHDGDGDRVRFVDAKGKVIEGDQALGLIARQAHREKNLKSATFVSTIHSNSGLFSFLSNHAIRSLTSDVGDRNVYLKMLEAKCNWGGESSGHIICTDYLPTGDGLFAALYVLRSMKEQSKTLECLASEIKLWPSLSGSFAVTQKPSFDRIPDLSLSLDREIDYLKEDGRILLRYSGTEPKLRLLVEGKSLAKITPSFQRLKLAIEKSL